MFLLQVSPNHHPVLKTYRWKDISWLNLCFNLNSLLVTKTHIIKIDQCQYGIWFRATPQTEVSAVYDSKISNKKQCLEVGTTQLVKVPPSFQLVVAPSKSVSECIHSACNPANKFRTTTRDQTTPPPSALKRFIAHHPGGRWTPNHSQTVRLFKRDDAEKRRHH